MVAATARAREPAASGGGSDRARVAAALIAAALSVAGYVLAKAVRDALYLATFPVERLPYFVIATGALSAILVGAYTRLNARFGPHRVVPALAVVTAASMVPLWLGARAGSPAVIAVLFAWTTISGTLLTSGFWAVLGERFDPRSARKVFGWMGVATTVGGLVGGFGANLLVRAIDTEALLLVLAASCVALAIAMARVGKAPRDDGDGPVARADPPARSRAGLVAGIREVATTSYLRDIALLVAVGTVAAGVADYMLKDVAAKTLTGKRELAEFFSLFHGIVGAVTLVVQVLVARPLVHRRGVGAALAALPRWLVAGALGVAAIPGLWSVAVLRGGENAMRNSFHRAGYELLFVPLSPATKRVVKPILDTLLDRLSDALGAALILLLVSVFHLSAARLGLAVFALAALELVVIPRVRKGYVATLSMNLAARAVELDEVAEAVDGDATARETVRSTLLDMRAEDLRRSMVESELGKSLMRSLEIEAPGAVDLARQASAASATTEPRARARARVFDDPVVQLVADLASADDARAKEALERWDRRDKRPLPFVVALLGRESLHRDATRILARAGDRFAGSLADHLDDPDEPFEVRRRLPRALAACQTPKAVGALTRALRDGRFEVRYYAACALERIVAHAGKRPAEATVWAVVRDELKKSRAVFEAQRLLDEDDDDPLADAVGRRGVESLRHVFRLLGLVLDPKPIALAYRAVVGDDPQFSGVGLEFLENVLPKDVKKALWPLIGEERRPPADASARTLDRVLEDLEASGAMSRKLPKREARDD